MKEWFKSLKNILSIALVLIMIAFTIVTSLNSYSIPEKVARKYLDYSLKGNYEKAYSLTTAKNSMTLEEYTEECKLETSFVEAFGISVDEVDYYMSDAIEAEDDETRATIYCSMYIPEYGLNTEAMSLVLVDGKWLVEE